LALLYQDPSKTVPVAEKKKKKIIFQTNFLIQFNSTPRVMAKPGSPRIIPNRDTHMTSIVDP
jgi:hypothetical protein